MPRLAMTPPWLPDQDTPRRQPRRRLFHILLGFCATCFACFLWLVPSATLIYRSSRPLLAAEVVDRSYARALSQASAQLHLEDEFDSNLTALQPVPRQQSQYAMPVCHSALDEGLLENLAMSDETCEEVFGPELFQAIYTTATSLKAMGGISRAHVEDAERNGHARVKLVQNHMYVKVVKSDYRNNKEVVLSNIWRAVLTSPEPLPNIDFSITSDDLPSWIYWRREGKASSWWQAQERELDAHFSPALWGLTARADERHLAFMMPAFSLFAWTHVMMMGWRDFRCRVAEALQGRSWESKRDVLYWRGDDLSNYRLRRGLVAASRRHPDSVDASFRRVNNQDAYGKAAPIENECLNRYLGFAEGISYSGRLQAILLCSSVVVSHKLLWHQHFFPLLDANNTSPTQNIVSLPERNFNDLDAELDRLRANPQRSELIAVNARKMATKYLSPAATNCYWRRLFRVYATLQHSFDSQMDMFVDMESYSVRGSSWWQPGGN